MYVTLRLWFLEQENWKRPNVLGMMKIVEVMDKISYLGVAPACSGVWNKCRARLKGKGSLSVVTVDKGLARPDMKLKVLENAYQMH